jgi:hypothetical protein
METRPRRQQTTEKIGEPLDLGIGTVHIQRRNGSPFLSARTFINALLRENVRDFRVLCAAVCFLVHVLVYKRV